MSKYLPIGERLREERERLGFNQTDFAAIGGAGRKTQFNYESGERAPDGAYLAAIAAVGADVAYILTGMRSNAYPVEASAPPGIGEKPRGLDLTPWEEAHIQNLRGCEQEDKDAVARLAFRASKAQHTEVIHKKKLAG